MAKTKILEKRKASSQSVKHFVKIDSSKFVEYDPLKNLLDRDKLFEAIIECAQKKDLDGVLEMIRNYRRAVRTAKEFGRMPDDSKSPKRKIKSYDSQESSTRPSVNARASSSRSTIKKIA